MTTNFTPAEQQAIEICEADGVCLSPSVMLNSLELLGFKPESATVAQLGAGARALRKLQRMSHGAIAALYEKASKLSEVEPELREQRVKVLLGREFSDLSSPDDVQEMHELLVRGMVAVHQHWEQIAQAKRKQASAEISVIHITPKDWHQRVLVSYGTVRLDNIVAENGKTGLIFHDVVKDSTEVYSDTHEFLQEYELTSIEATHLNFTLREHLRELAVYFVPDDTTAKAITLEGYGQQLPVEPGDVVLCQPTPGGFDVVTTSRKDFDNLQSIKKAIK